MIYTEQSYAYALFVARLPRLDIIREIIESKLFKQVQSLTHIAQVASEKVVDPTLPLTTCI